MMLDLEKVSLMIPSLMLWKKDLNSNFTDSCSRWAKTHGFKSRISVSGKSLYEMPCKIVEFADQFKNENLTVLKTKKRHDFLTIGKFNDDYLKIFLATKMPLYDKKKNLIGTHGYAYDLTHFSEKIISLITSTNSSALPLFGEYTLTKPVDKIELTPSENKCLFYLIRGKTAKQTAALVKLSFRTVEHYIESLRLKFNCLTKSDLITKAIILGYLQYIPAELIGSEGCYPL